MVPSVGVAGRGRRRFVDVAALDEEFVQRRPPVEHRQHAHVVQHDGPPREVERATVVNLVLPKKTR